MAASPSMGPGGLVVDTPVSHGRDPMAVSGLRGSIAAALASRTLRSAAAIGNLAAIACIGLSLMPKAAAEPQLVLAGMADPVTALMPWMLIPLLATSATASAMLLLAGWVAPLQVAAKPQPDMRSHPDARHEFRLDAIGHELRTPLTAIIGFSDMMQRELHGPLGSDRYQSYAGHICESGVTLLRAIEDAITVSEASEAAAMPAPKAHVNAGSRRA